MLSLHPRYPVLKVPAPARLAAAVAQGLIMPEGGPSGDGNIGLHISHTIGGPSPDRPDRRCRSGVAPSGIFASSRSSRASRCAMSGPADVDHATISLPPKSCTGARYALPQGCLNSVTPVPVFRRGAAAEKERPMAFSKVSPATPLYELHLC